MRFSQRGSGTRRERVPGGRKRQIEVKLSDDELVHIEAAARSAGLSMPSYLVAVATEPSSGPELSVAQRQALAAEIRGVVRVLRRAGDNLHRLMRIAGGHGCAPRELTATAEAVQQHVATFPGIADALDPRRSGGQGGRR